MKSLPLLLLSTLLARADPSAQPSLKDAAQGLFQIGVGLGIHSVSNPDEAALLKHHFHFVTPENCMKPAATQNESGIATFRQSDRFLDFAQSHRLQTVGHCLVWAKDDRTPNWFYQDGEKDASRELLADRMKSHMGMVLGRYGHKINQWDVVNEALGDGQDTWRQSKWLDIYQDPSFIAQAFRIARAADPDALLIYNDYRCEYPAKQANLIKLIEYLQAQNAPLDAIGLQGHYELDDIPFEALDDTITKIKSYGLKVVISEVDIDVVKRGKWYQDNGAHRDELKNFDPYKDSCPPEILEAQAQQYAQLFQLYARHADAIERVTFWNLHDGQSWLNYFPWKRQNHPLLFDRDLQPKPAFHSVIKVLKAQKRPSAEGP
ncbi:MAG: endo-1,4-beta-xylanase [Verrucomicrobiaceae bacterium]